MQLIARRKFLQDHVSTMQMVDAFQEQKNASMKSNFSLGNTSTTSGGGAGKHRGRSMAGGGGAPQGQLVRVPTANRSASLNVELHSSGGSPGGQSGALSPSSEDRRRSKSMYTMTRSQSISQINDISQIVGIAGMTAIFSAAGIPMLSPEMQMQMQAEAAAPQQQQVGRSQSMIFAHTEVENENDSVQDDPQAAINAMVRSRQSRSMSSLPGVSRGLSPNRSGKGRGSFAEVDSRMESIKNFTAHLGFGDTAPELSMPGSAKVKPSTDARPVSADPGGPYENTSGLGIAYQEEASRGSTSRQEVYAPSQRPHTANAAVHSSSRRRQEEEEAERQAQLAHEQAKADKKEELRLQTIRDKRRLCRSAEKDYGLPRDVFRNAHDEVNAKIGLKFLKAMSSNPGIYDDVVVKKRASSASGRRHHSGSGRRPPATNMW